MTLFRQHVQLCSRRKLRACCSCQVLELFTEPNFGGFGSDFCSGNTEESWRDRAEFVRVAAAKCQALYPGTHHASQALLMFWYYASMRLFANYM